MGFGLFKRREGCEDGFGDNGCLWIIIIIVVLLCCCGDGFGVGGRGC